MANTVRLAYDSSAKAASSQKDAIADLPADVQRILKKQGIFGLGESYIAGQWESNDLSSLMYRIFASSADLELKKPWLLSAKLLAHNLLRNPHALKYAFNIGEQHYDLGNDLFESMLDGTMTYTCGYWAEAANLEEAQNAKLQRICEKLELKTGMQVLDIGCGWGNFAKFAAERFGVTVTGVTVSKEQAEFARKACSALPVEILLLDYREVQGSFDAVVSIEMIEAVGRRNIPEFFQCISRLLRPKGKALVQSISAETFSLHSDPAMDQFTLWIMKHIFPDGYLPNIRELTDVEKQGLFLDDLHSFGKDYDYTLMAWAENFRRNWPKLAPKYGGHFERKWRFYLESCAALFRARKAHVYHLLYSKAGAGRGRIVQ